MVSRLLPLIESARNAGVLIVFLRTIYDPPVLSPALAEQYERRRYPNSICLSGTPGAEFVDGFSPRDCPNELVITKHRYSAFWGSSLDLSLRTNAIRTVVLTGIATEVCVESTARDAFFQDYQVVLAHDCMASFSPERHATTLTVVARSFGVVASSEEIRSVWDRAVPGSRNWQIVTKKARMPRDLRDRVDPRGTCLLSINMQRAFVAPPATSSALARSNSHIERILPRSRELLRAARQAGCMVIHAAAAYEPSERYDDLPGATQAACLCRLGSPDAQFAAGFEPHGDEQIVACQRFSAFADTPLALLLRSNAIRTLIVTGVTTECPVESTVRDAAARDFLVVVAADAVASHDDEVAQHESSLQVMARYFALLRSSVEITAQWSIDPPLACAQLPEHITIDAAMGRAS
jgi:nicotinamidase-related amidase